MKANRGADEQSNEKLCRKGQNDPKKPVLGQHRFFNSANSPALSMRRFLVYGFIGQINLIPLRDSDLINKIKNK